MKTIQQRRFVKARASSDRQTSFVRSSHTIRHSLRSSIRIMSTNTETINTNNTNNKRSRSRSPSPSPVSTKRARVEELRSEQTRLESQLKDLRDQLASHPDAIRERIKNDIIADAVIPRLTRLSDDKKDGFWNVR